MPDAADLGNPSEIFGVGRGKEGLVVMITIGTGLGMKLIIYIYYTRLIPKF